MDLINLESDIVKQYDFNELKKRYKFLLQSCRKRLQNRKQFISDYYHVIEKARYLRHPFTWSILRFLVPFLMTGNYDALIDVFTDLLVREPNRLETLLSISIVYIKKGVFLQIHGIPDYECNYENAINFLKKACALDKTNPQTVVYLGYVSILYQPEEVDKYTDLKTLMYDFTANVMREARTSRENALKILKNTGVQVLKITKTIESYDRLWRAFSYYREKKYNEAYEYIVHSLQRDVNNYLAHWLLSKIYLNMDVESGVVGCFFQCWRVNFSAPTHYEQLGRMFLIKSNYKKAYDQFKMHNAMCKLVGFSDNPNHRRGQVFYHFTSGMLYYQHSQLVDAKRQFDVAQKICKKYNYSIAELDVFSALLHIDGQILNLTTAVDFDELVLRVHKIYLELLQLLEQTQDKSYYELVNTKFMYILILLSTLNNQFIDIIAGHIKDFLQSAGTHTSIPTSSTYDIVLFLADHLKNLKAIDQGKHKQISNSLTNFIIEIEKYPSRRDIPPWKQRELIRSLIPFVDVIDGDSTHYTASRILKAIYKLTEEVSLCESEIAFVKNYITKERKELIIELPTIIAETIRTEFTKSKVIPTSKEILPDKKIKILTNVKLDNKGKLTKELSNKISYYEILEKELLKQNKKRYLIWLNYQTGECFLFGEPFIRGVKIREKYRRLITYLLINPRCCRFNEIYEVYNGKKYHYAKTRFCKKSTRKIVQVLNGYTDKELKNYSLDCGELNFGIDTEKHPWCIVNYESPINAVSSQYQFP